MLMMNVHDDDFDNGKYDNDNGKDENDNGKDDNDMVMKI